MRAGRVDGATSPATKRGQSSEPASRSFVSKLESVLTSESRHCVAHACDCEYDARECASLTTSGSAGRPVIPGTMVENTDAGAGGGPRVVKAPARASPAPSPSFAALPASQYRLLHHMSSMSQAIESARSFDLVIYLKGLPTFLTIAYSYDFVMHSLMAWAASHMAFTSNSDEAQTISCHYRLLSMQGLRQAIVAFSERNADAVLAASLLLSWQAADPFEWATLNKGTTTIVAAMQPWRHSSLFTGYIDEAARYKLSPNVAQHPINFLSNADEADALRYIYDALWGVERYALGRVEETKLVRQLMAFVQNVERHLPIRDPAMRFYLLVPTRAMLFWCPARLCREARTDPVTMVVLAHLYAISLTVQPVFAGPGAAHFRGLSITPIEDIFATLLAMHQAAGKTMQSFVPLSLMHFPMQSVSLFRSRMGLDPGVACADQSLTAIRYGLDPLAEASALEIPVGD